MKILLKVIAFLFLLTNFSNADLTKPNISLKPFDVLMIQLNSLQNNNVPYKNAGIEQTWVFAHPDNKKITGPFILYFSYSWLLKLKNKKYPITKLAIISIILLILALGYLRFYGDFLPNTKYSPAKYENGKLLPAENK